MTLEEQRKLNAIKDHYRPTLHDMPPVPKGYHFTELEKDWFDMVKCAILYKKEQEDRFQEAILNIK